MHGVTTEYHNMNLWSVALYYDAPVNTEKGTALSAYAGYFNLTMERIIFDTTAS